MCQAYSSKKYVTLTSFNSLIYLYRYHKKAAHGDLWNIYLLGLWHCDILNYQISFGGWDVT